MTYKTFDLNKDQETEAWRAKRRDMLNDSNIRSPFSVDMVPWDLRGGIYHDAVLQPSEFETGQLIVGDVAVTGVCIDALRVFTCTKDLPWADVIEDKRAILTMMAGRSNNLHSFVGQMSNSIGYGKLTGPERQKIFNYISDKVREFAQSEITYIHVMSALFIGRNRCNNGEQDSINKVIGGKKTAYRTLNMLNYYQKQYGVEPSDSVLDAQYNLLGASYVETKMAHLLAQYFFINDNCTQITKTRAHHLADFARGRAEYQRRQGPVTISLEDAAQEEHNNRLMTAANRRYVNVNPWRKQSHVMGMWVRGFTDKASTMTKEEVEDVINLMIEKYNIRNKRREARNR